MNPLRRPIRICDAEPNESEAALVDTSLTSSLRFLLTLSGRIEVFRMSTRPRQPRVLAAVGGRGHVADGGWQYGGKQGVEQWQRGSVKKGRPDQFDARIARRRVRGHRPLRAGVRIGGAGHSPWRGRTAEPALDSQAGLPAGALDQSWHAGLDRPSRLLVCKYIGAYRRQRNSHDVFDGRQPPRRLQALPPLRAASAST